MARSMNRNPKGLAPDPGAQVASQRGRLVRLGALENGMGDLVDGRRVGGCNPRRSLIACPLFCKN